MARRRCGWPCRRGSSTSGVTRPPPTSAQPRLCWPISLPCMLSIMDPKAWAPLLRGSMVWPAFLQKVCQPVSHPSRQPCVMLSFPRHNARLWGQECMRVMCKCKTFEADGFWQSATRELGLYMQNKPALPLQQILSEVLLTNPHWALQVHASWGTRCLLSHSLTQ